MLFPFSPIHKHFNRSVCYSEHVVLRLPQRGWHSTVAAFHEPNIAPYYRPDIAPPKSAKVIQTRFTQRTLTAAVIQFFRYLSILSHYKYVYYKYELLPFIIWSSEYRKDLNTCYIKFDKKFTRLYFKRIKSHMQQRARSVTVDVSSSIWQGRLKM